MTNKAIGIVAYITIIGWIIAFIVFKGKEDRSRQAAFHLEQSLGLIIVAVGVAIVGNIMVAIAGFLSLVLMIANIGIIVLWVLGLLNAINEKQEPIPLIGPLFQGKLTFIS